MPDPTPKIEPLKDIEKGEATEQPSSTEFRSYMEEKPGGSGATAGARTTPIELAKTPTLTGTPTVDSLLSQISSAQNNINSIRSNLNTPNLTLKRSEQYLLKTKLTDANNQVKGASTILGAQISSPSAATTGGPLAKVLGYLTDGENQLASAQSRLKEMAADKKPLNPAELLLVQTKLSQAQQAIEYSSVLVSKAVDIMKQIMATQI